jgi:predicted AlkP superfamily phosphohydrolase/phosphomutase
LTNAVAVGGAANVYINLQGREPTRPLGAIRRSAKPDRKRLQGDQRSVTNEQVFEIILKKPRAEDILQKKSNFGSDQAKRRRGERDFHVFSEDAGDVLIVTIPGYHLDFNAGTGASAGDFFQPSTFFGQHGYDPRRPEMKAIFYGAGPSFKSKTVKEVNNVDVAPTVAELIGIEPPADAREKRSIRRPSDFILPSFTRLVTCS